MLELEAKGHMSAHIEINCAPCPYMGILFSNMENQMEEDMKWRFCI